MVQTPIYLGLPKSIMCMVPKIIHFLKIFALRTDMHYIDKFLSNLVQKYLLTDFHSVRGLDEPSHRYFLESIEYFYDGLIENIEIKIFISRHLIRHSTTAQAKNR